MGLANSLALKLTGIDASVKNVEGGTITRNKKGDLTGILKDNAMTLVFNKLPPPSDEAIDRALSEAMKYFASHGVTSVHEVWDPADDEGYAEGLACIYRR